MEDRYDYLGNISSGAYGHIFRVWDRACGTARACKAIREAHTNEQVMRMVLREIRLLRTLPPHPNIVRLIESFSSPSKRVYMIFELAERSLFDELSRHPGRRLPPACVKAVAWQLLQALLHCHRNNVVHRDVKPANVLLMSPPGGGGGGGGGGGLRGGSFSDYSDTGLPAGAVQLCDFGFARRILPPPCLLAKRGKAQPRPRPRPWSRARQAAQAVAEVDDDDAAGGAQEGRTLAEAAGMSSYIMTRWYRPPEVLVGDAYGTPVDVWAFGATIAELAAGRPLFPGYSSVDQLSLIQRCLGPLAPRQAARLLQQDSRMQMMWGREPRRAYTLRQLLPDLEPRLFELVSACLHMDPTRRPAVEELLSYPYFWDVQSVLLSDRHAVHCSSQAEHGPSRACDAPSCPTCAVHGTTTPSRYGMDCADASQRPPAPLADDLLLPGGGDGVDGGGGDPMACAALAALRSWQRLQATAAAAPPVGAAAVNGAAHVHCASTAAATPANIAAAAAAAAAPRCNSARKLLTRTAAANPACAAAGACLLRAGAAGGATAPSGACCRQAASVVDVEAAAARVGTAAAADGTVEAAFVPPVSYALASAGSDSARSLPSLPLPGPTDEPPTAYVTGPTVVVVVDDELTLGPSRSRLGLAPGPTVAPVGGSRAKGDERVPQPPVYDSSPPATGNFVACFRWSMTRCSAASGADSAATVVDAAAPPPSVAPPPPLLPPLAVVQIGAADAGGAAKAVAECDWTAGTNAADQLTLLSMSLPLPLAPPPALPPPPPHPVDVTSCLEASVCTPAGTDAAGPAASLARSRSVAAPTSVPFQDPRLQATWGPGPGPGQAPAGPHHASEPANCVRPRRDSSFDDAGMGTWSPAVPARGAQPPDLPYAPRTLRLPARRAPKPTGGPAVAELKAAAHSPHNSSRPPLFPAGPRPSSPTVRLQGAESLPAPVNRVLASPVLPAATVLAHALSEIAAAPLPGQSYGKTARASHAAKALLAPSRGDKTASGSRSRSRSRSRSGSESGGASGSRSRQGQVSSANGSSGTATPATSLRKAVFRALSGARGSKSNSCKGASSSISSEASAAGACGTAMVGCLPGASALLASLGLGPAGGTPQPQKDRRPGVRSEGGGAAGTCPAARGSPAAQLLSSGALAGATATATSPFATRTAAAPVVGPSRPKHRGGNSDLPSRHEPAANRTPPPPRILTALAPALSTNPESRSRSSRSRSAAAAPGATQILAGDSPEACAHSTRLLTPAHAAIPAARFAVSGSPRGGSPTASLPSGACALFGAGDYISSDLTLAAQPSLGFSEGASPQATSTSASSRVSVALETSTALKKALPALTEGPSGQAVTQLGGGRLSAGAAEGSLPDAQSPQGLAASCGSARAAAAGANEGGGVGAGRRGGVGAQALRSVRLLLSAVSRWGA
ncbi:hypothetical protein HYH03_003525 [Edaphochlamys debaryana]|uniref:Protein kinase domain-containing protein n=1 Tax=Edaphochlamys debaryana TaxID=47281 RepID=A0A835YDD2_9CHLO|nr:hypothetical protein HYH03_003525 [Edaphochlamys debaryana]|eukprot:KAG2498786.1 hypothetical protein HYH03_003525 [Edaphochlamys debaryana]